MATQIKGGTLILDFKDEDIISLDEEEPTQLKKDVYSMISKSYGKVIKIINLSVDEALTENNIYVITEIYNTSDGFILTAGNYGSDEGTMFRLFINTNNEATITYKEI